MDLCRTFTNCSTASKRIARLRGTARSRFGSGTESIVRYRLHCLGIRVRTQVPLPGIVDLLVGDKFVIECDSESYHGGAQRAAPTCVATGWPCAETIA